MKKNVDDPKEKLSLNTSQTSAKQCTVYFDGACPLCSKEIATYQNWRGAENIVWVDASRCDEQDLGQGLQRTHALAKLHLRDENNQLLSGAAAFVAMWTMFPAIAWLVPILNKPWMIRLLDYLYVLFLKARPVWRRQTQA
jgi:predicted DCC family thiol-disulfide oxidoreductase YuxK